MVLYITVCESSLVRASHRDPGEHIPAHHCHTVLLVT
jgi:hypothetical protein